MFLALALTRPTRPGLTFRFKSPLHINMAIFCLILSSVLRDPAQLTLELPCSVPYEIENVPLKKNTSNLCQQLPYDKYHENDFGKTTREVTHCLYFVDKNSTNEIINEQHTQGGITLKGHHT